MSVIRRTRSSWWPRVPTAHTMASTAQSIGSSCPGDGRTASSRGQRRARAGWRADPARLESAPGRRASTRPHLAPRHRSLPERPARGAPPRATSRRVAPADIRSCRVRVQRPGRGVVLAAPATPSPCAAAADRAGAKNAADVVPRPLGGQAPPSAMLRLVPIRRSRPTSAGHLACPPSDLLGHGASRLGQHVRVGLHQLVRAVAEQVGRRSHLADVGRMANHVGRRGVSQPM